MLKSIEVTGFRALKQFRMSGLGRVNLLVGKNNCGKTSVLEAISILAEPGSPMQVWGALERRGETSDNPDEGFLNVAHLFHGHSLDIGTDFRISGTNDNTRQSVTARVVKTAPSGAGESRALITSADHDSAAFLPLSLEIRWEVNGKDRSIAWPISRQGALSTDPIVSLARQPRGFAIPYGLPGFPPLDASPSLIQLITTEGTSRERVVSQFEDIVLTEGEDVVLAALRTIEPTIERIASVGARGFAARRGGFFIRTGGKRVPIGSMGDGMWRLLGIVIALVRARGGMLLVDEIDTGLHYTVLSDMWRLVTETAERLDVQVFATTHSRDCYEALASIAGVQGSLDLGAGPRVSLQRIERDHPDAVAFAEAEIREAAERGIEVR